MTKDSTDDMLSGWLPLNEAVEQAAAAWNCELERAWDRLRRRMSSGVIKSKTQVENVTPGRSHFSYEQILPNIWADPQDDGDGKHGSWRRIRTPIFINEDDLKGLLQRLGSGTHHEMEGADQAILLHMYDQISAPSSKVAIGPLTNALREDRSAFNAAFIQAIQAGLFDNKELEFLCQGQWSPLDSTKSKTVIEAFDDATFEKRYVMMAALPLVL